jgi:hypothetical protein
MNGHGVGKQVIGAIAIEQRRSKQRGRRVVIGADRECSLFTSGGLHAFLATR